VLQLPQEAATVGRSRARVAGRSLGTLALSVLLSAPVDAETYQLLRGSLSDGEGRMHELAGWLEASSAAQLARGGGALSALVIDDFALSAGARALTPRQPIEYEGLTPLLDIQVTDQILLDGSSVGWLRLRSGGELVAEGESELTFRFLELRGDVGDGGQAVGELGPWGVPRRLQLAGRLVEVDQSFRLLTRPCPPPSSGGGGVIISFPDFDLSLDEPAVFEPSAGATLSIARVAGGASLIEGGLVAEPGTRVVLAPAPLELGPVTNALAPSLDDLGITAPSGADITLVDGALTVSTQGDLLVSGDGLSLLPDFTSVTLIAAGEIVIESDLDLPADASLSLEAGGGGVVAPPVIAFCPGLRPIFPAQERELGRFSLVATAAEPIAIDVRPGSDRNAVRPGSSQRLPVAILGSEQLDLRDLDPRSPRLGPGAAPPQAAGPRRRGARGAAAWLGLFSVREAQIAFGDALVCLLAERRGGGLLEGCDAIDTRPRRRGPGARRD
jgi:hypothetical protein